MAHFQIAQQLYIAYFGRPADPTGRENFGNRLLELVPGIESIEELVLAYRDEEGATSTPIRDFLAIFSESQESKNLYTGTTEQFVRAIYSNVLGREIPVEDEGLQFWTEAIEERGLDRAFASLEILFAAVRDEGPDRTSVLNKTAVAQDFTDQLNNDAGRVAYSGDADAAFARTLLNQVNNQTNLIQFQDSVDDAVAEIVNPTQTLTLAQALALETLPARYVIQPALIARTADESTVAGLEAALAAKAFTEAEQAIIEGARNAESVLLQISYTLADTAVNLAPAFAAGIPTGNLAIEVIGASSLQFLATAASKTPSLVFDTIEGRQSDFFTTANGLTLTALATRFVSQGVDVNVLSDTLSVPQANALAALTMGVINSKVSGTISELQLLEPGNQFTLPEFTGTVLAKDLTKLAEINLLSVNASSIDELEGTAPELNALLAKEAAGEVVLPRSFPITVQGPASLADLTTFDQANGNGEVSYTLVQDSADALVKNSAGYVRDAVDVSVQGPSTLSQLAAIDALTTGDIVYQLVRDSIDALLANTGSYIKPGVAVTVVGTSTIAQLAAVDLLNGDGVFQYSSVSDTPSNLVVNTGAYVRAGVDVVVTQAATLAQLSTIDSRNGSGTLTYSILDSAGNFFQSGTAQLSALATTYVRGDVAVSSSNALSVAQANVLAGATSGVVSATVQGTVSQLRSLEAGNNWGISVSGGITAADLLQLDSRSLLPVNATQVTSISGDASQLALLLESFSTGITPPTAFNLTVDGPITIDLLSALDALNGNGSLNYTAITDLTDEIVNPNGSGISSFIRPSTQVTLLDDATVAQLQSISSANSLGSLSYTTIKDTAANLTQMSGSNLIANVFVVPGKAVAVEGNANLAQLAVLDDANATGTLNYGSIVDSVANFFSTGATPSARTISYVNQSVDVTVNGALTVAQANAVATRTTGVVTGTVNGTVAQLLSLEGGGALNNWNLTVSGSVAAIDLLNLDRLTQLPINAQAVTTITGTASEIIDLGKAFNGDNTDGVPSIVPPNNFNAVISGTATVRQLQEISDLVGDSGTLSYTSITDVSSELVVGVLVTPFVQPSTDVNVVGAISIDELRLIDAVLEESGTFFMIIPPGDLNYSMISDTAAALVQDLASQVRYIRSGTSVNVEGSATLSQLQTIDAGNGNASFTYSQISDLSSQIFVSGNTLTQLASTYIIGQVSVAVAKVNGNGDPLPALTVTQANTLAGRTSGSIDANVTGTITQLQTLEANNSWGITVQGVVSAQALLNLDNITDAVLGAQAVTSITGSASQFDALLSAFNNLNPSIVRPNNFDAFVTDAASISLLTQLQGITGNGRLFYDAIADEALNIVSQDGSSLSAFVQSATQVRFTDSPNLNQLNAVDSIVIEQPVYGGIRDSVANLFAEPEGIVLSALAAKYILADTDVDVFVGGLSVDQLNVIVSNTTGLVSAVIVEQDIESLLQLQGGRNSLTITVADSTLTLEELNQLGSKTDQAITVDGRYNEQSQLFDFEGYELGDLVVADNSGDDIVLLGEGNDLVIAGDGADRVEGGGGINSISYEFSDEAVDVDLLTGLGTGGFAHGDQLSEFSNVKGSNFADTFTLNASNNTVSDRGTAVVQLADGVFTGFDKVFNFTVGQDRIQFDSPNPALVRGDFIDGSFLVNSLGTSTLLFAENGDAPGLQQGELAVVLVGVEVSLQDLLAGV